MPIIKQLKCDIKACYNLKWWRYWFKVVIGPFFLNALFTKKKRIDLELVEYIWSNFGIEWTRYIQPGPERGVVQVITIIYLLSFSSILQIKDTLHMGESSFLNGQLGTAWKCNTSTKPTKPTTIRLGFPQWRWVAAAQSIVIGEICSARSRNDNLFTFRTDLGPVGAINELIWAVSAAEKISRDYCRE